MSEAVIPPEIKSFLEENIDSIAQWEGLLLMRAQPEKEWETREIAKHLYLNERDAASLLLPLALRDLVEMRETSASSLYRYRPKLPELDKMVEHAARLYRQYLIPVTHIIHSAPKNKIQQFADAFRIRKD